MKVTNLKLKKKRVAIYLYPLTHKRLHKGAQREGMTVSEMGAKIIFDHFANVMEKP